MPQTYVDREHLKELNAKKRAKLAERPYQPYTAHVVIGGYEKMTFQANDKTGETELRAVKMVCSPKNMIR